MTAPHDLYAKDNTVITRLLSILSVLLLLLACACLPPERTDYSPDDDDAADDDDAGSDCDVAEGEVDDCEGGCHPLSWLGDGECDEVFNCAETGFDAGDCQ
ncbi:MAG: hypothetical protein VX498_11900 [Myxococcota bacterium]|nr:hypothetical protein [Myxococcota bacterium]